MNFNYKDKSVDEIAEKIIVQNDFKKTLDNLKNVVVLMNFERKAVIKQKTKKYFIPNLIFNIKEGLKYDKKISDVIDKSITTFNVDRKELMAGINSGKY